MTPEDRKKYIDALVATGMTEAEAANILNKNEGAGFDVGASKSSNGGGVGPAGTLGVLAKGVSLGQEFRSLATAGDRQEQTVQALKDAAEKQGEAVDVDDTAVNLATVNARGDSESRASTLAELLDQGVDPAQASKIVQNQGKQDTATLLTQLNAYGQQKTSAEEQARSRRAQFDLLATQAGLPIDENAAKAQAMSKVGDTLFGAEALFNPPQLNARTGRKMKYEDGGSLQTTQGASDHSENPMMVTNKDGSPAVDEEGNQIEVTGKETIIPDWLMEQLIAAAKKGPKELNKVFKDEIIDEERFEA